MSSKSILVVEDDRSIREIIQMILELEGYQVITATNGKEGVEVLQRGDSPQLIVLDLMMPVMDGWEFLRAKQRVDKESVQNIPVIVLSASGEQKAPPGATAFFPKPFAMENLIEAARQYCA